METIDELKYYFCLVTSIPIIIDFLRLLSHPKREREIAPFIVNIRSSRTIETVCTRELDASLYKGIQLSANDDKMSRKCLIMCSLSIIDVLAPTSVYFSRHASKSEKQLSWTLIQSKMLSSP